MHISFWEFIMEYLLFLCFSMHITFWKHCMLEFLSMIFPNIWRLKLFFFLLGFISNIIVSIFRILFWFCSQTLSSHFKLPLFLVHAFYSIFYFSIRLKDTSFLFWPLIILTLKFLGSLVLLFVVSTCLSHTIGSYLSWAHTWLVLICETPEEPLLWTVPLERIRLWICQPSLVFFIPQST